MAIYKQEFDKVPNKSTMTTVTRGNNSELYNVTEEAWGNGNKSIISDLITKNVTQTNAFDEYKADYITDTMGNHSIWVNEAYEISSNSNYKFVGDPENLSIDLYKSLEDFRKEFVALRSGFNDDRHESDLTQLLDFDLLPQDVINNFFVVDSSDIMCDSGPKIPPSGNLFTDLGVMYLSEISDMTKSLGQISVKSQLKKAKLAAENKIEKQKQLLLSLGDLPDSVNKERITQAIADGDLTALFVSPSNEEKKKTSTYNRDAYEAKAVEIADKMSMVERNLG